MKTFKVTISRTYEYKESELPHDDLSTTEQMASYQAWEDLSEDVCHLEVSHEDFNIQIEEHEQ